MKIFPATLLGPGYLRQLSILFPGVPLIPTGGIKQDNIADFLQAGALAVGVGEALVNREAVGKGNWEELKSRAVWLTKLAKEAKR